jgi:hypothetical protein
MAITLVRSIPLNALELVCEFDDAIDQGNSDIEEYKKTADMKHLKFHPNKQPTIFLCNFDLKGKEAAAIKNAMLSGRDDEGNPQLTLGTWSFRVIKYTLKDIRNPDYIEAHERIDMKKDKDGYAHDDLLAILDKVGVVNELFTFYNNLVTTSAKNNAKN